MEWVIAGVAVAGALAIIYAHYVHPLFREHLLVNRAMQDLDQKYRDLVREYRKGTR